jgi:hypothetical protein
MRYENASWRLGDTGRHRGLIFTPDDLPSSR